MLGQLITKHSKMLLILSKIVINPIMLLVITVRIFVSNSIKNFECKI